MQLRDAERGRDGEQAYSGHTSCCNSWSTCTCLRAARGAPDLTAAFSRGSAPAQTGASCKNPFPRSRANAGACPRHADRLHYTLQPAKLRPISRALLPDFTTYIQRCRPHTAHVGTPSAVQYRSIEFIERRPGRVHPQSTIRSDHHKLHGSLQLPRVGPTSVKCQGSCTERAIFIARGPPSELQPPPVSDPPRAAARPPSAPRPPPRAPRVGSAGPIA